MISKQHKAKQYGTRIHFEFHYPNFIIQKTSFKKKVYPDPDVILPVTETKQKSDRDTPGLLMGAVLSGSHSLTNMSEHSMDKTRPVDTACFYRHSGYQTWLYYSYQNLPANIQWQSHN
jgi:hypothetical protein